MSGKDGLKKMMPKSPSQHPFDALVRRDENEIRLAEAALLFAADHCRSLRITPWLSRLDELARRVDAKQARMRTEQIDALREVLVDEEHFRGNTANYYDPRNGLLNQVLERRLGIPIALSVVWLDIGHQLGWPFVGVGLPGHFLIKRMKPDGETLIDPFNDGCPLRRADCERMVTGLYGREVYLTDEHFQASTKKAILARMLNNLRTIYLNQQAWYDGNRVLARLLALRPGSVELERELAMTNANLAKLN